MTTIVEQCLQTEMHLACVKGPDLGCVIPVIDGIVVGRGRLGLCDPYLSRSHVLIAAELRGRSAQTGLYLSNLSKTNPLRRSMTRKRLRPGLRATLGSGTWIVRGRPRENTWPGGIVSRGNRAMLLGRFLIPLMMIFFVFRIASSSTVILAVIAALAMAGCLAAVIVRRRWRQWDEARLLLTSAAQAPDRDHIRDSPAGVANSDVETLAVLRQPGRRAKSKIPMGRRSRGVIAVVGEGAQRYAQWIGGQIRAHGYDTEVRTVGGTKHAQDGSETVVLQVSSPPDVTGIVKRSVQTVLWADALTHVPPTARIILQATEVGSRGWLAALPPARGSVEVLEDRVLFEDLGLPDTEPAVSVPVGRSATGLVSADLAKVGPHALVVGGTGAGKSEFLTTFALSHALSYSPDALRMILIDFKGGAGLDHLSTLPHVEHSLSDLDATQIPWLLRSLGAVLRTRKRQMQGEGVRSWADWEGAPPRLLVLVDEFHVLAQTHPTLMEELVSVAAQGRSLGVHLVLATQRPSGSVNAQLRATLDLRIALRCSEASDSIAAIGSTAAASLPRIAGRALIGGVEFQTAYAEDPDRWITLATEVWGADRTQAVAREPRAESASWKSIPDPLPESVVASAGQLGVYEVAGLGCRPLRDIPGSIAIVGPENVRDELTDIARSVARSRLTSPSDVAEDLHGISGVRAAGAKTRPLVWIDSKSPLGPSSRRLVHLLMRDGGMVHCDRPTVRAAQNLTRFRTQSGPMRSGMTTTGHSTSIQPILVLDGVTDFFTRLEANVPPDNVRALWERVLSAASAREIVLIATDTRSRYDLSGLPGRIIRLPDHRALLSATLATYLPTQLPDSDGLPVTRPSDLDRYTSPVRGRVLAQGFVSNGPVWAQVPVGAPGLEASGFSRLTEEPADIGRRDSRGLASHVRATLAANKPVWVIGANPGIGTTTDDPLRLSNSVAVGPPSPTDPTSLSEPPSPNKPSSYPLLHFVPSEMWMKVVPHISEAIVAIEPGRELCRLLSQRYPEEAVWVMASQPYRNGQSVFATGSSLHFVEDPTSFVRDFLPNPE